MTALHVAAFYRFSPLPDIAERRAALKAFCAARVVRGSILLAPEGLNGTIAGTAPAVDEVLAELRRIPGFAPLTAKFSTAVEMPFGRMKVRLKKEIVTMGVPGLDPTVLAGVEVEPQDWNALISDPDVLVIDTRNHFECAYGSFVRAIDPQTKNFGEFPAYVAEHLSQAKGRKIAMFCTGGIRCEKATSYMRREGFAQVYQLKGGILNYLEKVPEDQSLWRGTCFVFDEREALGHGLAQATSD